MCAEDISNIGRRHVNVLVMHENVFLCFFIFPVAKLLLTFNLLPHNVMTVAYSSKNKGFAFNNKADFFTELAITISKHSEPE